MGKQRWFLVTNTENLESHFRMGMFVDSSGFNEDAYLKDATTSLPEGYLPLFPIDNLEKAINAAIIEDPNLIPCLIEIDSTQLPDEVFFQERHFPSGSFARTSTSTLTEAPFEVSQLLVEAPLPISVFTTIMTENANTKGKVDTLLLRFLGKASKIKSKTEAKLFKPTKKSQQTDLPVQINHSLNFFAPDNRFIDYQQLKALGGSLFTAYYATKNGKYSTEQFQSLSGISSNLDQDVAPLRNSLFGINSESLGKLYQDVLKAASISDNTGEIRYELLHVLSNVESSSEYTQACKSLKKSLEGLIDRTNLKSTDEILDDLRNYYEDKLPEFLNIAQLITMLFMRDHIETLLKYYHPNFSEKDYFLLGLFAGAVKGITKIPDELRCINGLMPWVSYQIAKNSSANSKNWKAPPLPDLIHEKYFKPTTTDSKIFNFYKKFCAMQFIDSETLIDWEIQFKSDYLVDRNGKHKTKKEPMKAAVLNVDELSKALIKNTEKDTLFDFNSVFSAFKKAK